jgi:nucleoside-diphosphate-sugar epimerase
MAKFFLTGATGFIGSCVAQQLVECGHQVLTLVRETSNKRLLENLDIRLKTASLFNEDSYINFVEDIPYFIHLAGVTKAINPEDYYKGNVLMTKILIEAILKNAKDIKRFLLVSSQAAVGPSPSQEPVDESFFGKPLTDYGKSKLECEKLVQSYKNRLPITIVRPPIVYGPRDTDVYQLLKLIKKGINIKIGKHDQLVNLVYVEDLAKGLIDATISEKTIGKVYYICEEKPYYWSEVVKLSANIMNSKVWTINLPFFIAKFYTFILEVISKIKKKPTILNPQKLIEIKQPFWVISSKNAKLDFAYKTNYPLESGMKKTIDWYIQNNWL